jgi:hypothetical protein
MKQHQNKLNRKMPEDIPLKTVESFRTKKRISTNSKNPLECMSQNKILENKKEQVQNKML